MCFNTEREVMEDQNITETTNLFQLGTRHFNESEDDIYPVRSEFLNPYILRDIFFRPHQPIETKGLQPTAGLTSTCPQTKVNDHPALYQKHVEFSTRCSLSRN